MKLYLSAAALILGATVSNVDALAFGKLFRRSKPTIGMPPLPEAGKPNPVGKRARVKI